MKHKGAGGREQPGARSEVGAALATQRREFLGALALGGLAASCSGQRSPAKPSFDEITDVIVVGSGAAGLSAAATAVSLGSKVIALEKAGVVGGTTAKSGGFYWIFDNEFMRRAKIADPRPDALRFLARIAAPHRYNSASPTLGLTAREHACLAAYYDNGSAAVAHLAKVGALKTKSWLKMPDYFAHTPENKAPRGRTLGPSSAKHPRPPLGHELVRQLDAFLTGRGVKVRKRHRASELIVDGGRVVGLVATKRGGSKLRIGARKGVIFCSGGFAHSPRMCESALRGPIFGSCAVPSSEGDFLSMASSVNAELGNMSNAWWAPILLEEALTTRSVPLGATVLGDSMIIVDRYGKRVFNESAMYHERGQAHFFHDPNSGTYPRLLLFMIWDDRCEKHLKLSGQRGGMGVIKVKDADALAKALGRRLGEVRARTGGFTLDDAFAQGLRQTIERFNGFAAKGKDLDFARGETPFQRFAAEWVGGESARKRTNPAMMPLDTKSPLYCVILAPGVLDTKGGPVTNGRAEIVDASSKVIDGLYGAGNCIAAPALGGYHAGGVTIGSALTFGYIAANSASKRAARPLSQGKHAES